MDIIFEKEKLVNISRISLCNGRAVLYRTRKSGHYKVGDYGYDYFYRIFSCIKCNNAILTATTSNFLNDFELAGVKELRRNGSMISAYIDDVNFYKIRGIIKCIEEVEIATEPEKDIDI